MTCFLFILWVHKCCLCGSLLFARLPEEKWTPWQISTKFDKFHSTLRDMFQGITFLHGSWNNPTRKEKRFDEYTSVQRGLLLELNLLGIRESSHKLILDTTMQKWAALVLLFKILFAPLLPSFPKSKLLPLCDLLLELPLSPALRGDSSSLVRTNTEDLFHLSALPTPAVSKLPEERACILLRPLPKVCLHSYHSPLPSTPAFEMTRLGQSQNGPSHLRSNLKSIVNSHHNNSIWSLPICCCDEVSIGQCSIPQRRPTALFTDKVSSLFNLLSFLKRVLYMFMFKSCK